MHSKAYLLFQKAEAKLIEEKSAKLFGICRLLDQYLKHDFNSILERHGLSPVNKKEAVEVLRSELEDFCDSIAASFPGVGLGYYSTALGAIVTYAPSHTFGSKVGMDVGTDHIGIQCMTERREMVGVGSMVRGEIMNAVRPLIRNDQAIGFVWANETIEDIYTGLRREVGKVVSLSDVRPLLGIASLILFASEFLVQTVSTNSPDDDCSSGTKAPVGNQARYVSIRRFERYLKLFLDSVSVGIVIVDLNCQIVFVNHTFGEMANVDPRELVGSNIGVLLSSLGLSDDNRGTLKWICGSETQNGALQIERLTLGTSKGQSIEVNAMAASVQNHDASPTGYVLILEDVKGAQQEEERTRRAEKLAAIGELAAAVAHEIRNPLTILAGSVQMIPEKIHDKTFLQDFAHVAAEEIARLNATLESLLRFAHASDRDLSPQDLNKVVQSSVQFVRRYAEKQGIAVEEEYGLHLPIIQADFGHLKHAILNLLVNAIQAMPSGGRLGIRTRRLDNSVQVEVSDTGPGISPKDEPFIFEPFFSTGGGTGLGLALVHRIVDEHGGYVSFKTSLGEGTRFYINLPISNPPT